MAWCESLWFNSCTLSISTKLKCDMLDLDPNLLAKCRCWQWAVVEYSWYSKSKNIFPAVRCQRDTSHRVLWTGVTSLMSRRDARISSCQMHSDLQRFTMIYNSCRYYYYYYYYYFFHYYYHCYYYSSTCHSDCNNNNNNNNKNQPNTVLDTWIQKKRYIQPDFHGADCHWNHSKVTFKNRDEKPAGIDAFHLVFSL